MLCIATIFQTYTRNFTWKKRKNGYKVFHDANHIYEDDAETIQDRGVFFDFVIIVTLAARCQT